MGGSEAAVTVSWAATSASDGRFSGVCVTTIAEDLRTRFRELRARGEGYLEVHPPDRDYPALLMGFRGEHAVIHRSESPESMLLRLGDGSVPSDDVVSVLILDDRASFTGEFVLSPSHAWQVIEDFMRTGATDGPWCQL